MSNIFEPDYMGKDENIQSSTFTINNNHIFTDNTARNTYFVAHPLELVKETLISVGSGFQMWNGTSWLEKTAIVKGEKGKDGKSIYVKDEGTLVEANIGEINFTGIGVTVAKTSTGKVEVNISGGSGGGGANINDTTPSTSTAYSGTKVESIKSDINNKIGDISTLSTTDKTDVVKAVNELKTVNDTYATQLTNIANNKADKSYVDSKSAGASATPRGAYATLSALQTAHLTDDGNTYVVTSNGNIYDWIGTTWTDTGIQYQSTGIAVGSVKHSSIDTSIINLNINGSNILNPNDVVQNSTINNGNISTTTGYIASGYIPVYPAQTLIGLWKDDVNGTWYDHNQNLLRNVLITDYVTTTYPCKVIVPTGAYFLRTHWVSTNGQFNNQMVVIGDTYPSSYIPYGIQGLPKLFKITTSDIPDNVITTTKIANNGVTINKISTQSINHSAIDPSIYYCNATGNNIFNPSDVIEDKGIRNGIEVSLVGYRASGYMPIFPGQNLIGFNVDGFMGSWFNRDKTYLREIIASDFVTTTYPCKVKVPTDAYFVRTHWNKPIDTLMVIVGNTYPSSHIPYGTNGLPENINLISSDIPNDVKFKRHYGKKIYCFGDSVTGGQGGTSYPSVIAKLTGALVTNYAIGGSVPKDLYEVIAGINHEVKDYSDVSSVTIMIGHNQNQGTETLESSSIKNISDFNLYPSSFYGYICKSIEYILSQNKDIRIYICGLHHTIMDNWTNSEKCDIALREIAKYYSLPFIDILGECGIGAKNLSLYSPDNLHLNSNGGEGYNKLGEYIAYQLEIK